MWGRREIQTEFWLGKRDGKNQLVRTMRTDEDNIKMCLKEVSKEDVPT